MTRARPWPMRACLILLAAISAAGLWRIAAELFLPVAFDPNEGWNAYHAAAAIAGAPLYPHGLMIDNYPPLSFYIVGALGRVVGDNIFAGRMVSLAAFLFLCLGLYRAARTMGCARTAALFAALFFAAGMMIFTDYVGMDDPQILGHAIAMAGLLLVLRTRTTTHLAGSALLFALAFFVKHNLVVLPLTIAIWLFLYDRRAAIRFAGFGLAFLAAGLVTFRLAYGIDLWSVLVTPRLYSGALLAANMQGWLVWSLVPLGGLLALAAGPRNAHATLCCLYAALAGLWGAFVSGGAGVDTNAMFDADMALALCAALLFARETVFVPLLYMVPILAGLWLNRQPDWNRRDFWLSPMQAEAALAQDDIAFLRARPGPALCETLSYCYWAGKHAAVDVFNVGQQIAAGARDPDSLIRTIGDRGFGTLEFDTLAPFALGPRVKRAVRTHYRIHHSDDEGFFFIPR